jgi:hypothetical protein
MNKTYRLLMVSVVVVGGFSCSTFRSHRSGVVECSKFTAKGFLEPYHKAWKLLEPAKSKKETIGENELVHLGLPTETSVIIWYALAEGAERTDDFSLKAKHGGSEHYVPGRTVRHEFNQTHSVGRIQVSKLAPGSTYTFVLRGGGFRVPRKVEATTKPSRHAPFSFLVGSCFQPWNSDAGDETFVAEETTSILRAFKERAQSPNGPSFYLGLGDQIYVDPGAANHARIAYLHGKHSEQMRGSLDDTPKVLRSLYRYHLGLRPMDAAFSVLPSAMMWDDHDIRDGWGSQDDESHPSWQDYYKKAREAFVAFQAARNPAYKTEASPQTWETLSGGPGPTPRKSELSFSFHWGNAEFFVVDGRSDRNFRERRGMSDEQLDDVDTWLKELKEKQDEPRLLVFCFPVPLAGGRALPGILGALIRIEGQDDLRERPYILKKERSRLLKALYGHVRANRKHRLLILSGDVHYSGIQLLRDQKDGDLLGYEIVSSGLAQTKFNSAGPLWFTVGRTEYGVTLENRGFYAGPSFAEIFLDAADPLTAPSPKVLFYPAAERPNRKGLTQETVLKLDVTKITSAFALDPKNYPKNEVDFTFFGRQISSSRLSEFLIHNQWHRRIKRGTKPTEPATAW